MNGEETDDSKKPKTKVDPGYAKDIKEHEHDHIDLPVWETGFTKTKKEKYKQPSVAQSILKNAFEK